MPIIFDAPYLRIHLDPARAVLETEWLGFCNSEELRSSLREALALGRAHGVRGWIGNNLLMRTIRPIDQDWMNETWFPEFARLGVKRLAVVMAKDALNRMGVDHILQRATSHTPFDTQYFSDILQARQWAGETTSNLLGEIHS